MIHQIFWHNNWTRGYFFTLVKFKMEITQGILTFDIFNSPLCFKFQMMVSIHYSSTLLIYSHQVQWDDAASIPRPDRISPWEIEPLLASAPTTIQPPAAKYKRPRLPSDVPDFGKEAEYFISYNRFHFKWIPASRVRLGGCFADVFTSLFKGDTTVGDSTYWEAGLTQSDVTQVNSTLR